MTSELPFLDRYGGQTTEELIALEGAYRIDSIVLAFEGGLAQKEERVGFDALTAPEQAILAIEAMELEVNNGGYDQFFVNSSRQYASVLAESLRSIGCPRTADITDWAIAALELTGPATPEAIESVIHDDDEARSATLSALDGEYFTSGEPIADRLFAFIKERPAEIRLP